MIKKLKTLNLCHIQKNLTYQNIAKILLHHSMKTLLNSMIINQLLISFKALSFIRVPLIMGTIPLNLEKMSNYFNYIMITKSQIFQQI